MEMLMERETNRSRSYLRIILVRLGNRHHQLARLRDSDFASIEYTAIARGTRG